MQRAIESGSKIVVGMNKFRDEETATPSLQKIDPEGERRQCERVAKVRAERDPAAWRAAWP